MFPFFMSLFDIPVIVLKGFYRAVTPLFGGNSPRGGQCGGKRGNIGDFKFDGGFSNIRIIMLAQFAAVGINH